MLKAQYIEAHDFISSQQTLKISTLPKIKTSFASFFSFFLILIQTHISFQSLKPLSDTINWNCCKAWNPNRRSFVKNGKTLYGFKRSSSISHWVKSKKFLCLLLRNRFTQEWWYELSWKRWEIGCLDLRFMVIKEIRLILSDDLKISISYLVNFSDLFKYLNVLWRFL